MFRYRKAAKLADALSPDVHYTFQEKGKTVQLTEEGFDTVEEVLGYDPLLSSLHCQRVGSLPLFSKPHWGRDKERSGAASRELTISSSSTVSADVQLLSQCLWSLLCALPAQFIVGPMPHATSFSAPASTRCFLQRQFYTF